MALEPIPDGQLDVGAPITAEGPGVVRAAVFDPAVIPGYDVARAALDAGDNWYPGESPPPNYDWVWFGRADWCGLLPTLTARSLYDPPDPVDLRLDLPAADATDETCPPARDLAIAIDLIDDANGISWVAP